MAETNFQIKGLKDFNKAMTVAPVLLGKELKDAMATSIAEIHREAVPRTPVDTGKLRQGYREKIQKLKGILTNDLTYAMYQHEGFFNHPKGGERHYLLNAVKAKKDDIDKNFQQAINNVWKFVERKTKLT